MLVVAIALRILSGADPKKLAINSITLMVSMAAIGGMLAAINITSEKWEFSSLKAIGFGFAFQEVANAMLVVAIALLHLEFFQELIQRSWQLIPLL